MALHVVSGRTPWWAPLAVNVLGGLFNDWQQRERNKKENAMYSEAIKQAQAISQNDTGLAPIPEQDIGQGLLNMNIPLPDGYNDNGWANSFHKTDTPLTQFELGTAGIAPTAPSTPTPTAPLNAWANALGNSGNALAQFDANTAGIAPAITEQPAGIATQGRQTGRIPTALDIYNVLGALAGTKRFGSVTPERITALFAPYLKANEEARQEQMRNAAADDYLNQTSGAGRINSVMGNVLRGITPESLGNMVYNQNKPVVSTVDTGGQIQFFNTDPMTGIPTNVGAVNRTLTPQEIAMNAYNNTKLQADIDNSNANRAFQYYQTDQANALSRERLDMERNQATGLPFTDNEGYQRVMLRNGQSIKITEVPGLTPTQEKTIKIYEDSVKNIVKDRERLRIDRNVLINKGLADDPRVQEIDKQLSELDKQEKDYQSKIYEILQSVSTGWQGQIVQPTADKNFGMDIGAKMLGIERPTITTHFNAPRKRKDGTSYGHAGTDYAMPKDHPIRFADVGTTMRVTKVANDPNGYGNHVEAQGELTGADGKKHIISIVWAHMGNNTVNVTKGQEIRDGDLIGKVGNTGNSRGKNGGYHLHLETRIDGKRVDPTKFTELITPYIAYSKTNKSNTFIGVTPPPEATVIGRPEETTVAYRNPRTGDKISQSEVEEFEHRADNGKLKYARNKEELHEYWRKNGYVPTESYNANNTQGQEQPTNGDKFPIAEQPTAQRVPTVDPFDYRPSYMSGRVKLPLPPKTIWARNQAQNSATFTSNPMRVQPAASISFTSPTVTPTGVNIQPSEIMSTTPQQPTASTSIPDHENETQSEKALAALNGQYNTWDEISHNRYPFPSMSNFGRV